MIRPLEQTALFAGALLSECGLLEWSAASYDAETQRVSAVLKAQTTTQLAGLRHDLDKLAPWLKARNAKGEAIWCRPADAEHPWLMLDDLNTDTAHRLTRKYAALAVETSAGNAQAWLLANRDLSAADRTTVRRALTQLIGADPGAISEPRWGRCPGFKSGKQNRAWTNLLADSTSESPRFDPSPFLTGPSAVPSNSPRPAAAVHSGESDESRREFGYACHALRAGLRPELVAERIAARALNRGKRADQTQALAYARKTVSAAQARL